jgi:hypothetical protein
MNAPTLDARYREAVEILDEAEDLVREGEAALAAAGDPTMVDICATRLDELYRLQDEVCEAAAPVVADRERALRAAVCEVVRSARGEVGSDWTLRHRRWMSVAVKARIIRRYGRRFYEGLPW